MCKNVREMNHTLRVTRNHPYIKEEGAICPHEMQHLISEVGCTSASVLTQVMRLNQEDLLSMVHRRIDLLAGPEHKVTKISSSNNNNI